MSLDKIGQTLFDKNTKILNELSEVPSQNEVCSSYQQSTHVIYENKDFALSSTHSNYLFGVRSIVDQRLGFVTTNAFDDMALKKSAREAQLIAKLSLQSEFHILSTQAQKTKPFMNVDPKLAETSTRKIFDWGELLINEAKKDSRVCLDRASLSLTLSVWSILNSLGIERVAHQVSVDGSIMGMAKTENEVTSFDYDDVSLNDYSSIEKSISKLGKEFRLSILGNLGAKKGESYKGPVLLHPAAVMDIIGEHVSINCNGLRHQDGMSSWKDKKNQVVASDKLTIYEDPLALNRPGGWMPFDREGVLTKRHELIQKGVLNHIAHSCFSAKRENLSPTGNSLGGPRSVPSIGFSNLAVSEDPLGLSEEGLLKLLGQGLLVKRFSGNSDPVSGQFSGVAKNSWWIKQGTKNNPVQEVMLSGNIFELLKNVLAVGKDSYRVTGGGLAPYVLIDGVSVTAG
jgi:PmbA protein